MDEETPRPKADGAASQGETPRRASRTGHEADAVKASQGTAPKQDANTIFDDLDEDTRVLRGKGDGGIEDVVEAAREKLRLEGHEDGVLTRSFTMDSPTLPLGARVEPVRPPPDGRHPEGAVAEFRGSAEARAPQHTVAGIGPAAAVAHAAPLAARPAHAPTEDGASAKETRVLTPAELDAVGPVTERPSRVPPKSLVTPVAVQAAATPRQIGTVPAVRVAVLATDVPGEVRLIALHDGDDAPPGAALALLVPLTAGDGESVSRLFRGGE
jgi:hypothetical protein